MAFQTAPHIPFRPAQCPHCRYYAAQIERCRAYVTESVPRPLLGFFSGESDESCARFALLQTTANSVATAAPAVNPLPPPAMSPASSVVSAASTVEATPVATAASPLVATPVATAATATAPVSGASAVSAASAMPGARIHCPKCQHENASHLLRCSVCGANLLPGESLGFRLAVFVLCLLLSGFCGWLAYAIYNHSITLPDSLNDPFKVAFIALVMPFAGLVTLLRRTPRFTRYANRAERHVPLNLRQAAADYTQALEHAPEKEHAALLRKRADIYEKLGQIEDATRDRIAVTYAEGAYQTGASLASLMGADADTYALSRAKGERTDLVSSGRAVVLGFCPTCKDAVQLNGEMRCPSHPRARPKRVRMVVPSDVPDARREILAGKKRRTPRSSRDRVLRVAILLTALATGYLLIKAYILNPQKAPEEISASQPAAAEETIPAALGAAVFADQGVSFEYPANWELIASAEKRVLLNSTLEGLGEYDYLGGVYLNGADSCPDCAQMTLVVVPLPGITEVMDSEQYADIKANAEQSMGKRLLDHQMVTIGGIPAAVSKYIGRSQENQLWDVMLVIPGAEQALMFSCSAQPDSYTTFEPVFARAIETLAFAFSPTVEPSESSVVETAEPASPALTAARVKGNAVNVREGPGTGYAIVGRLPGDSAIQVAGRDEAAGWLNILEPPGWVSADLVDLSAPIESLPLSGIP